MGFDKQLKSRNLQPDHFDVKVQNIMPLSTHKSSSNPSVQHPQKSTSTKLGLTYFALATSSTNKNIPDFDLPTSTTETVLCYPISILAY
jgi:hypothetical protein